MIKLLICCHAQTHKCVFNDRATAEAELAALQPKLGADRWENRDKDQKTHTIKCPTGDFVVVLEKVEAARILDPEADMAMHDAWNETIDARLLRRSIQARKALMDAGVFDPKTAI